ncbi:hypothetical protein HN51_052356 [Arachis hypogaea]
MDWCENLELLELSYNTKLSPWTFSNNLNSNSRLTVIILETTNLIGSLLDIFDSFPVLKTFYLSENNLKGVLPNHKEAVYLLKFRKAIHNLPSNWFDNNTIMCKRVGVVCCYFPATNSRYLEKIELNSRRLNGTIPLNIYKSLVNLRFLNLGNNFLSGPLPSFSGLSYLQSLYLSQNNFTSIPHDCFRGLENLELLDLSYNTLDLSHQLEYQLTPNRHHTRDYKPHRLLVGYL